jgi:hypothetical protein
MVDERQIKKFCKATKAKEIDVCQNGKGGVDFKVVNGEKSSQMCAKRVKCSDFE